jgi:hypothetical protein
MYKIDRSATLDRGCMMQKLCKGRIYSKVRHDSYWVVLCFVFSFGPIDLPTV